MAIQVIREDSQYHSLALVFPYDPDVVDFCRMVKEKYGWKEFTFSDGKWRFDNTEILNDFNSRYVLDIDPAVYFGEFFGQEETAEKDTLDEVIVEECRKEVDAIDVGQIKLRDYQKEALVSILVSMKKKLPGNDIVVLPTAAGKSIIIAALAKLLHGNILILQPSKELVEQNFSKLAKYVDESDIGIFSASMNQKVVKKYTLATIGSIFRKPELFIGFKLVLLDECDLLNPKNLDTMYMKFFSNIGVEKVFGFTASPYRMDLSYYKNEYTNELTAFTTIKMINRLKGYFWKRIIFNVEIQDLINRGYLCPLEYQDCSVVNHEDLKLNKSQSDFDLDDVEVKMEKKRSIILDTIERARNECKSILVFCTSVKQARDLSEEVPDSAYVSANTPDDERDRIVNDFKNQRIKIVFNVSVFSVGFDYPALDGIILLRSTRSLRLFYQMLGRGFRIAPGKDHCNIYDLSGTVSSIGRVETIKLVQNKGLWDIQTTTKKGEKFWHNRMLYFWLIK